MGTPSHRYGSWGWTFKFQASKSVNLNLDWCIFYPEPEVFAAGALCCRAAPCLSPDLPRGCPTAGPRRCYSSSSTWGHWEEPPQSCWLQAQQLLLCFPKYLICRLYLLLFFLMKKDFRSSAVDLELLKEINWKDESLILMRKNRALQAWDN